MIYVSTGGISNEPAWKTSLLMMRHGINNIELSGGCYSKDQIKKIKKIGACANLRLHNYFPPPLESFVMNLASNDDSVFEKTKEHIKNSIKICSELEERVYSFHAGFLIDPLPEELGRRIAKRKLSDRQESLMRFVDRLNSLSLYAASLDVELLVENNVISKNNYTEFGGDPLLMTNTEECLFVMRNTPNNINLLLDVAHLKVSAQTLGFNPKVLIESCEPWIKGYHLSDNDGTRDSNSVFTESAWFWPYLKNNVEYISIEVYGVSFQQIKELSEIAIRKTKSV